MCEGVSATAMPASSMASTLAAAVPLPPDTMAPAWPIRLPGGGGHARNECGHRFVDVLLDVGGGFFFGCASDFADHDDGFGLGILVEELDAVQMVGSVDWIAPDSDASRLPVPGLVICQTAS